MGAQAALPRVDRVLAVNIVQQAQLPLHHLVVNCLAQQPRQRGDLFFTQVFHLQAQCVWLNMNQVGVDFEGGAVSQPENDLEGVGIIGIPLAGVGYRQPVQ